MSKLNSIIRLRRDNDYNYEKIKDKFIPAKGEICLVDTARDGLKAVCGDGKSTFGELKFLGELIVKGYYYEGYFYSDIAHTDSLIGSTIKLYIDLHKGGIYHYDGTFKALTSVSATAQLATEETAGIMKLYQTTGQNIDGTMSQKAITDELDDKVEALVKPDEELLIFSPDLY